MGFPPQAPPAGPGHRTCLLLSSLLQNEQILTLLWVDRCCGFGSAGMFQGPGKSANSTDWSFPRRIAVGLQDPPAGLRGQLVEGTYLQLTFLLKPRSWGLLLPFPGGQRGGVCRRSAGGLRPLLTCRSSFQATGRRGGSWPNAAELVSRDLVRPGDQHLLPLSHLPFPQQTGTLPRAFVGRLPHRRGIRAFGLSSLSPVGHGAPACVSSQSPRTWGHPRDPAGRLPWGWGMVSRFWVESSRQHRRPCGPGL